MTYYTLLNLFGYIGSTIGLIFQHDRDPEIAIIAGQLKKYKFLQLARQLISIDIIPNNSVSSVFNLFENHIIASDDDISKYIALIVIDAFEHLNIIACDEELNYYKKFLVNWFNGAINNADNDFDVKNIKTINDVFNCMIRDTTKTIEEIREATNNCTHIEVQNELLSLVKSYDEMIKHTIKNTGLYYNMSINLVSDQLINQMEKCAMDLIETSGDLIFQQSDIDTMKG